MTVILTVHTEVNLPDSSIIERADYYANDKRLVVTFNTGRRYEYLDVPKNVIKDWTECSSTGSFFRQYIRGHYDDREMADSED